MEAALTTAVEALIGRMGGTSLVIDGIADRFATASKITVEPLALRRQHQQEPLATGGAALALASETFSDAALVRAVYDHPSAQAYGDSSYTVAGAAR